MYGALTLTNSRRNLWRGKDQTPVGNSEQTGMMKEDLWTPLSTFVSLLKETEYKDTETSLFDHTNIVITSEFGRSIHGNVDGILKKDISEDKKKSEIGGQDISAHWRVTSCAFLGGGVQGKRAVRSGWRSDTDGNSDLARRKPRPCVRPDDWGTEARTQ